MRKIAYLLTVLLMMVACGSKKSYTVKSMTGQYLPVTTTNHPDSDMLAFVNSYKVQLDREMNKVIGHSAQDMSTGRPESLLTNLTSDLMREIDTEHTQGKPIDIAFMNVHGIRAPIAKGEVTVGDIFDAYPFDNALYIVQLKGIYLTEIFESYASIGGAGVSKNVKLTVKDKKLIEALVDGKPVDKDKVYTIITLDYLAEGNDKMDAMLKAEWSAETGIKLRDYMLESVKKIEAKGEKIVSKLDGRITIIE